MIPELCDQERVVLNFSNSEECVPLAGPPVCSVLSAFSTREHPQITQICTD